MCLAMGCCEGGALVKAVCLLAGCRPHARGWGVRVVKWLGGVGWVAGLDGWQAWTCAAGPPCSRRRGAGTEGQQCTVAGPWPIPETRSLGKVRTRSRY